MVESIFWIFVLFCFVYLFLYANFERSVFNIRCKAMKLLHIKYNANRYSYNEYFDKSKWITEYTFKWKDIFIKTMLYSVVPDKNYFEDYIYNSFDYIHEKDKKLFLEMEYTFDYILRHLMYVNDNYDSYTFNKECKRIYEEILGDIVCKVNKRNSDLQVKEFNEKLNIYNNYIDEYNKNLDLLKEFWDKVL